MKNGENILYIEELLKRLKIKFKKYIRPKNRLKICIFKRSEIKKLNLMEIAKLNKNKFRKFKSALNR